MIREQDVKMELLLKQALKNGGDFSELYLETTTGTTIISEGKRIERYMETRESGIGLRVVLGDRQAYAYTNDPSSIHDLADTVASAIKGHGLRGDIALRARPSRVFSKVIKKPCDLVSLEKIEKIKRAEEKSWGMDASVVQVRIMYADMQRHVTVANSMGFIARDTRDSILFYVQGVVAREGIIETGYEPVGGSRGFELLEEIDPEEIAASAIGRALVSLSARKAPAGIMPVVLSSEAGGTMVHEAIGHGLEADLAGEGLSVYSDRIGEKVASEHITVVDDATIKGARGSFGYDDEGTPSQRTVLVENGILKAYMSDLITSSKYGLALTGNGRRQSYRHRPIPRMTNTLIEPGNMNPDDIVKMVDKGIFVKKMGGGQVNTVNGDFVFEISEGYLIENGQITEPIRGATLIGNGPKILSSITDVGGDLGFGIGTCGKDGQGVPVSDAQPTLLIPEITIGGSIQEE